MLYRELAFTLGRVSSIFCCFSPQTPSYSQKYWANER
jgi:hypothetical protein